ncbi:uncharacterized protein SCHCODRAFT_02528500 [Schizophyllum commune H4-8]|uniref:uncharacterized protein n=1 Tax=Schizophyllum commune (strain H4-8 / FGSC 9210) TaxID=578458 RepID=UPI00215E874F|nr:uncharacterized protein SCHCODRAFT_02528500 [Schizophyllum commune H4-8]KAI5897805.1 hypothetical protein SCHCODRAFT_02528500 [Schizophyllum commune H4-8]
MEPNPDSTDVPMPDAPPADPAPRKCSQCTRLVEPHLPYVRCAICRANGREYQKRKTEKARAKAQAARASSSGSMPPLGASTSTSATNKRSSNCSSEVSTWKMIRNPVTGEQDFECTSAYSIEISRDGRRMKKRPTFIGQSKVTKAKDKPVVDHDPKTAGIAQKLGSHRIPFSECQTKEDLHDELRQTLLKSSHANFRAFYSIIDVEHDHKRRVEEIASELRKVEGLSFSLKHYHTKVDPQRTFYFAKYRCQCWAQRTADVVPAAPQANAVPSKDCGGVVSIRVAEDDSHTYFPGQKITVIVQHTLDT